MLSTQLANFFSENDKLWKRGFISKWFDFIEN